MAKVVGTVTFLSGTGLKTISIGIAATWAHVVVRGGLGGDAFLRSSEGWANGTSQQVCVSQSPAFTSAPVAGKIIQWRDSSGTVIFEASVNSYTATAIVFDVTTAPATMPQLIIEAGN